MSSSIKLIRQQRPDITCIPEGWYFADQWDGEGEPPLDKRHELWGSHSFKPPDWIEDRPVNDKEKLVLQRIKDEIAGIKNGGRSYSKEKKNRLIIHDRRGALLKNDSNLGPTPRFE